MGNVNVPTRVVDGSERAGPARRAGCRLPTRRTPRSTTGRTATSLRHDRGRLQEAVQRRSSSRPASTTCGATICARLEHRATVSTSPLSADPIGVGFTSRPTRPRRTVRNRRCSTSRCSGRYTFPWQIALRRQLPDPERLPVLADHRRGRHHPDAEPVQLRVALLRREPDDESIRQRQPDELPDRQVVRRRPLQGVGRCSTSTTCSTPIRSPTSP